MDGGGRRHGGNRDVHGNAGEPGGTPGRVTRTARPAVQRAAQRRAADSAAPAPSQADVATAAVERKGAGAPVPDATRRIAESHLGADLSGVRVHGDEDAQADNARRAGTAPDLSGLGTIRTVDHFAAAVHDIQRHWSDAGQTVDTRAGALLAAANHEMAAAHIPVLRQVLPEPMSARGAFTPDDWSLHLSLEMLQNNTLSDDAAADLCNTTLHEARHAEQDFLAARWAAGLGDSIATIARNVFVDVARTAHGLPLDARHGTPAERALAQRMYTSTVTDGVANDRIERDTTAEIDELNARTAAAQAALTALNAGVTATTIATATAARDALRRQVPVVEAAYRAYRAIPHEADAHEVGDTAEVAFRRPP